VTARSYWRGSRTHSTPHNYSMLPVLQPLFELTVLLLSLAPIQYKATATMSNHYNSINNMEELCYAIVHKSPPKVEFWAEKCNVNADIAALVPTDRKKYGVKRTEGAKAHFALLHLAIVQCFVKDSPVHLRQGQKECLGDLLEAIRLLIAKGADVSSPVEGIELELGVEQGLTSLGRSLTPGELLLWLERICSTHISTNMRRWIDSVFELLQQASNDTLSTRASFLPVKTEVPQATLETWKGYLFSEKSADMLFVCKQDNAEIPAHSELLSIASPLYFEPHLQGKWGEVPLDQEGRRCFVTQNSSAVMKAILTFVYTGEVEPSILDDYDQLTELFSVSHMYELTCLTRLCEIHCMKILCPENAAKMLQVAVRYGTNHLRGACLSLIHGNKGNAQLWHEFCSATLGGSDEAPQHQDH